MARPLRKFVSSSGMRVIEKCRCGPPMTWPVDPTYPITSPFFTFRPAAISGA